MPEAKVGMKVMVDMAGVSHGGVSMGQGVSASGTIESIDPHSSIPFTVKLDISFGGADTVSVSADRVKAAS